MSDPFADMDAAIFASLGKSATWTPGPAVPVLAILSEPDLVESFGQSNAILPQRILKVRRSEVALPSIGDIVVMGARRFKIIEEPRIDSLGAVWTCGASERNVPA